LQRKARSRSDAPGFVAAFGGVFANFGTIGGIECITTGTIVVGNGCTVAITAAGMTIGTGVRISVSIVGGAGGMSSSPWTTR